MALTSHDPASTYVHLRDDGAAELVPVTDTFWQELVGGARPELTEGRLVTGGTTSEDWPHWEMHPEGDEIVILLAGEIRFLLETPDGARTVHLAAPGAYVLVPRGAWHTAECNTPTQMLFITPGRNTQHRPR